MQENDHIRELFSESFKNFEEPVRPELWNNIAAKIGATSVPGAGNTATGIKGAAATAKFSISAAAWIAGAALVVSGIAGYYYFTKTSQHTSTTEIQSPVLNSGQNNTGADNSTAETGNNISTSTAPQNQENKSESGLKGADKAGNPTVLNKESNNTKPESSSANETSTTVGNHLSQPAATEKPASINGNQAGNAVSDNASGDTHGTVTDANKPSASAYPTIGYAPLSVQFTLTGDQDKAEWDFGDGTSDNKTGGNTHIFEKPGVYAVTVKTSDHHGNLSSEVVKIEVLADLNIKNIPNIFTPNQDGSNDVFSFRADHLTDIEVTIYDKSGKLVTRFTNPEEGWNGLLGNGEEAPEGTYFYVIFATGNGSKKHQQGGTITLIR